jgi:hypothetical protein
MERITPAISARTVQSSYVAPTHAVSVFSSFVLEQQLGALLVSAHPHLDL